MKTGCVTVQKKNRPSLKQTEAAVEAVKDLYKAEIHTSTRRAALALDMSTGTLQRILKGEKFHPLKVHMVQQLHPDDLANRLTFAEEELDKIGF